METMLQIPLSSQQQVTRGLLLFPRILIFRQLKKEISAEVWFGLCWVGVLSFGVHNKVLSFDLPEYFFSKKKNPKQHVFSSRINLSFLRKILMYYFHLALINLL